MVILSVCLSFLIVYLTGQVIVAQEETEELAISNKIVVVKTFEEPDPVTLFGTPGTTVIWINHSKYPVQVVFIEKQVVLACGSPANFVVNKEGTYESIKIPSGGTASLCFTEKGRYAYKTIPSKKFIVGKKGKEHFGTVWIK
jgi:plastocyanin